MNIAILGHGTVGGGVCEIAGKLDGIEVKRILELRETGGIFTDRFEDIESDPEIELVAETMGGLHPAYEFAKRSLEAGKHFVTSNKLLVSVYGPELTGIARQNGKAFLFDAACAGGIPYLSSMETARDTDQIAAFGGILNGTTNFILDAMQNGGMTYASALAEAQRLGYAERDPSSDVDGLDTMRKLVLCCAVGFGAVLPVDSIPVAGISKVIPADIEWAAAHGGMLKLCAFGKKTPGGIAAYVEPAVADNASPLANVRGSLNYAWYEAEYAGHMGFVGAGAGRYPTASDVIRDIVSVPAGRRYMTGEDLRDALPDNAGESHPYYLRVPAGTDVPASLIASKTKKDGYAFIETVKVSVTEMHEKFAAREDVFFAGIQKG